MSRAFLIKPCKVQSGLKWLSRDCRPKMVKNGGKKKNPLKLIQMNFSADENGKIGITDLEKNIAKSR